MIKFDLTGARFGRLVAVARAPRDGNSKGQWLCHCDCGATAIVRGHALRKGLTKSCGCLNQETRVRLKTKHGMHDTPEYHAWEAAIQRCTNDNNPAWKFYGARGISVCEEWLNSFEAFLAHIGRRPSPDFSLDRIDNDGNYEPGNVRWADWATQGTNKRRPESRI
jgi:hypothetical protein